MPVLKTAAERAAYPITCSIHDVPFVQFRGPDGTHSMGCPECVKPIRDHVRKLRAHDRKWRKSRKRT